MLGVTKMMDYRPEDLAAELGVDPSTVGRWEKDKRSPRDEALAELARVLNVSPAWLRYGEGQGPAMYWGEPVQPPESRRASK